MSFHFIKLKKDQLPREYCTAPFHVKVAVPTLSFSKKDPWKVLTLPCRDNSFLDSERSSQPPNPTSPLVLQTGKLGPSESLTMGEQSRVNQGLRSFSVTELWPFYASYDAQSVSENRPSKGQSGLGAPCKHGARGS